jgi:hypothetical protein
MEKPEVAYLGTTVGEWPVAAFISEDHAAHWAGEKADRRRIWPVLALELGAPLRGKQIPATTQLVPAKED